jgi:hypothetical protein
VESVDNLTSYPQDIHRLIHRQNVEVAPQNRVFHSIHSPYYYYCYLMYVCKKALAKIMIFFFK